MENHVRIYRENPIAWIEKPVLRFLRRKYGKDKKRFVLVKSVYTALCEIESDFQDTPVTAFGKTVGTYAGCSRETAGKCMQILIKDGLIKKDRVRDEKTKKYLTGTFIQILSSQSIKTISEPLSRYPSNGLPQQWVKPTPLSTSNITFKKLNINNNVDEEKTAYYAEELAKILSDKKSITFYKAVLRRNNPDKLIRMAKSIVKDGGAKNPAAVFVNWLKKT